MFSRISVYLNHNDALTVPEFIDAIKKSFTSPVPNVEELPYVFDAQSYFEAFSHREVKNISAPYQFSVRKDPSRADQPVTSAVFCRKWSNTAESSGASVLTGMPTLKPRLKGGRPVFHTHESPGEAECERRFGDFAKHLEQQFDLFRFSEARRAEWRNTLAWLRRLENSSPRDFEGFWPLSPEEASDWLEDLPLQDIVRLAPRPGGLRERLGEELVAPAAEAAAIAVELEDNVDFQGILTSEDTSGFRQVYHARRGNVVLMEPTASSEDSANLLGDWETEVCVGLVRSVEWGEGANRNRDDPEGLQLLLLEPWVESESTGGALMPLWLYAEAMAEKGQQVDTSWAAASKLPWKEVQAIPLRTWRAFYEASLSRYDSRTLTEDFMASGRKAIHNLHLQPNNLNQKTLVQNQPYAVLHYCCQVAKDEREAGVKLPEECLTRVAMSMRRAALQRRLGLATSVNRNQ